ncbi:uncharacterized protein LOC113315327 [Papaver somniferum]|uniref:uncharacterized protein LOC113315327 n=1 Tax=Papaver somniferum TaxID=3469 RepID=UPI000E6FA65C|nr:uncharacterized protein LOC113315327 [Papaver somniferum]
MEYAERLEIHGAVTEGGGGVICISGFNNKRLVLVERDDVMDWYLILAPKDWDYQRYGIQTPRGKVLQTRQQTQKEPSSEEMVDGTNPPPPPQERKLRELTSPCIDSQPLCITITNPVELKPNILHHLPKFKGLPDENSNRHLRKFRQKMTSLRQSTEDSDTTMLQAFPFSLKDSAASVRKEISGILQITVESLYEYWDRYKKLVASCPHHNISPTLIIQYFYQGLLLEQRNLIDAAGGGSLTEKTISQATSLIESMSSNEKQFYTRHDSNVRRVSEIGESPNTEHRLNTIEKAIHRITSVVAPPYEEEAEVNALFPNQRQSYANKQVAALMPTFGQHNAFQPQQQNQSSGLEEMMKAMMQNQDQASQEQKAIYQQNLQYQQKNDNAIKDLQTQMGQLATDMNSLKAQASTKLSSQLFVNPREQVNAVTLRSGIQTEEPHQQKEALDPPRPHKVLKESSRKRGYDILAQHP